jgi:hypothetical protein
VIDMLPSKTGGSSPCAATTTSHPFVANAGYGTGYSQVFER